MADPRYAIAVDELVAGARVSREEQVESQPVPASPPAGTGDPTPYGDAMSGDADGD